MSTDAQVAQARPTLRGHIEILRIDHWFKNVFVLPGIAVALTVEQEPGKVLASRIGAIALGMFATCLIASSNYTVNEILDAVHDRHHPTKHIRPVASGRVN